MIAGRPADRTDGPAHRPGLIDELRVVLALDPDRADPPGSALQKAIDVLLAHVRALSGPDGVDAEAARRLTGQITALHGPLTELLTRRRETLEPGLPAGEALFAATADAEVICSVGVHSIPG